MAASCAGPERRARAPGSRSCWPARWPRGTRGWPTTGGGWPRRMARPRTPRSSESRTSTGGWFGWPGRPGAAAAPHAEVRSWTSAPPFPARTTYIPMIGEELARIRGLGNRDWMALQDRVLPVVHPERDLDDDNGWLYGFAKLYSAPPTTSPPETRPSHPRSRAGRSWRRGTFSCPGCFTSPCTSSVSARVVRHSACRSLAAKAGSRLMRSNGVARRRPSGAGRHRWWLIGLVSDQAPVDRVRQLPFQTAWWTLGLADCG
jgi:hypothetical protein